MDSEPGPDPTITMGVLRHAQCEASRMAASGGGWLLDDHIGDSEGAAVRTRMPEPMPMLTVTAASDSGDEETREAKARLFGAC